MKTVVALICSCLLFKNKAIRTVEGEGLQKQSARVSVVKEKKTRVELKGKLCRKLKCNICMDLVVCYFKGICRCFIIMSSNEMYLYIFCSILQLLHLVVWGVCIVLNSP